MILTDQDILTRQRSGDMKFKPQFDRKRLGSNSYDVTLGNTLLLYSNLTLDAKIDNPTTAVTIPKEGYCLDPGVLYLGHTNEAIDCGDLCPQLEGKSSIARLGICVHLTAGFGDIGFKGYWTLEITCVQPVIIYPDMPIAQVYFLMTLGKCLVPYNRKQDAKYAEQPAMPVASSMWKNFVEADK